MTSATAIAVAGRLPQRHGEGFVPLGGMGGDAARHRPTGHPVRSDGSRLTLEQRLDSVWEGLRAGGAAECPICHGRMEGSAFARCRSCGSELL
jgi:hypothetical protein